VGGGTLNSAAGENAAIAGGWTNATSGNYSTVGGGRNNNANAERATIPGGSFALANSYGQMAYASGGFLSNPLDTGSLQIAGSAQTSIYVLRARSTVSSGVPMLLDVSDQRPIIANGTVAFVEISIVAAQEGGTAKAAYQITALVEGSGGALTLSDVTITTISETNPAWNVSLTSVNNLLTVLVFGEASTTVRWVARMETAEVMR
jgi:hypothetical protein